MSGTRTAWAVLLWLFVVLAALAFVLIVSAGSAGASCGRRAEAAGTATPGLPASTQVNGYADIEQEAWSAANNEAVPVEDEIAPVTASTTAQSSISVLPWILGVLAVAVAAGGARAYARSPQRQASRVERLSR